MRWHTFLWITKDANVAVALLAAPVWAKEAPIYAMLALCAVGINMWLRKYRAVAVWWFGSTSIFCTLIWLAFRQRIVRLSGFRNPVPAEDSLGESQTSPYWQVAPAAAVGCSPCPWAVQGGLQEGCSGWERDSCIYATRKLCWQTISFAPQLCCSCATSALPTSVCTPSLRFGACQVAPTAWELEFSLQGYY